MGCHLLKLPDPAVGQFASIQVHLLFARFSVFAGEWLKNKPGKATPAPPADASFLFLLFKPCGLFTVRCRGNIYSIFVSISITSTQANALY
jgi:hypothetical protein